MKPIVKHNHITRDIKEIGKCHACDLNRLRRLEKQLEKLKKCENCEYNEWEARPRNYPDICDECGGYSNWRLNEEN